MQQPLSAGAADVPIPALVRRRAPRLPATLTPLVGREAPLAELAQLLRAPECRLVTLCGLGGVGKSRLALQLAHTLSSNADNAFPDGICFVALAPVQPEGPLDHLLATSIASALGLTLAGPESAPAQIASYLRERRVLLVLDNFEHMLAGTPFLARLLQATTGLKLLCTSRERLNLRDEHVLALPGLAFPAPGDAARAAGQGAYAAVQLFEQLARAATPDFSLGPANSRAVAEICQLVDGLPLAIELAARWTPVLSCAEIAAEIAQNLDFLSTDARDSPAHQRSLRAVFAQAWGLLTAAEQRAARRMALFSGDFTQAAALAVAGAGLPLLAALVGKSLVRPASDEPGAAARYMLPEPLRQYAAEQLAAAGELPAAAADHARYYLGLLAERQAALRGAGQQEALELLGGEIDQLRSAWRQAAAAGDCAGLRAAAPALFHFYDMRSWFQEGADAFQFASELLSARRDDPAAAVTYAVVLARQGWFSFHLGSQREARLMLELSLGLLEQHGQHDEMVFPLNYLAATCAYLGDDAATQRFGQRGLELASSLGDRYGQAVACNILGQIAYEQGRYAQARAWSEQSLRIEQQLGNRWSMAFSLTNLGRVAFAQADYPAARLLYSQSLETRAALGDTRGTAICLNRLGDTAVALGEHGQAAAQYRQSLDLFQSIGNQWGGAAVKISQARLALAAGRPGAAVPLLQEALRMALDIGSARQVAAVAALCAPLVPPRDRAWAAELERVAASGSVDPEADHAPLARVLAWQYRPAGAAAAPPPARPVNPDGLTAREREVLRLVAQGLTDAQVAEQLVISARTVGTHLASIYGKLGLASRSAATRYALEHGLA